MGPQSIVARHHHEASSMEFMGIFHGIYPQLGPASCMHPCWLFYKYYKYIKVVPQLVN